MQITWKASFSASCLHAVLCRRQGLPTIDAELAQTLEAPAEQLQRSIDSSGFPVEETLTELASQAAVFENNRQLVEVTLSRLFGASRVSESVVSPIAAGVAGVESALLALRPELVDQLAVRGRPLREQWESRGPGLLRTMARMTDDRFIAPMAEVVLVTPWVGGSGRAWSVGNRVLLEAVLTNPHVDLPEALRLGWLLGQLNYNLPVYSEVISPRNRLLVSRTATLPLVLAAAETVEWAALSPETLRHAIGVWHLPDEVTPEFADQLLSWWQAYFSGRIRWEVALAALDQMLPS